MTLGVHTSNGGSLTVTIPHGLGAVPTFFRASAASVGAKNIAYVTATATNIIVNYDANTPSATNNIIINWEARL